MRDWGIDQRESFKKGHVGGDFVSRYVTIVSAGGGDGADRTGRDGRRYVIGLDASAYGDFVYASRRLFVSSIRIVDRVHS